MLAKMMADHFHRNLRTKCFRRSGLHCDLWNWCILIIILPCLSYQMNITTDTDNNVLYIPYHSPLDIICTVEPPFTRDDIFFKVKGKNISTKYVTSFNNSIHLHVDHPDKHQNTYYCKNGKTNQNVYVVRVVVDSPPQDVQNFSCISTNMEILNCSWKSPEKFITTNYNITYEAGGNILEPLPAKRTDDQSTRYCFWNRTSTPRYREQVDEYNFVLVGKNVFGTHTQHIKIDHYSIVIPDPPSNLKVLNVEPHTIYLQWDVPSTIVDFLPCGIDHKIEYQIAKIDNTSHFRRVNTSSLPAKLTGKPDNRYQFNLTDLPYAHMKYDVRIYIKSKMASDKLWSKFTYKTFYTASERPRRPPDMTAGAFNQALYDGKRMIYVYWKKLEEYEQAGANFTYKVLLHQGGKSKVLYPDRNKSLSYVILDANDEALKVSVWSVNTEGSSSNYSSLYIPNVADTTSLTLTSFTKLAYENGTYELSWVGIQNIDNYTLFWCQHNTTNICVGTMYYTTLNATSNTHVIDLPQHYRYQFAISANNGTKTSGMVWANCDISKDSIAMYGFPMKLTNDIPGKTYVRVTWSMDCALQDGIITGYNITYCPIVNTSSLCDASVGNKSVYIEDPKVKFKNITGLLPFRTYQFTIALNTIYGLKTIQNSFVAVTTSEDTPTKPKNVTISSVQAESVVVSWDPPLHRNGNIGKYVIYNYTNEIYTDKVTDVSSRSVRLRDLPPFSNLSITVQACNIALNLCSKIDKNDGIFLRTRIGKPGKLKPPTVTNNPEQLRWEPPEIPGGTVDLYQIRVVKDDVEKEIINTTELYRDMKYCEGVSVGETYQVRAVNFDSDPYHGVIAYNNVIRLTRDSKDTEDVYPGDWSLPSSINCRGSEGLATTLTFMAVFSLVVALIFSSIKLYKKYRKMEDIKPVFPNSLINVPDKEMAKYFGGWNTPNNEEKPSSDIVLLLPNVTSTPESKQTDNCGASDHTDSTALSDTSRGPIERQASTSDEGSDSSLQLEIEPVKSENITEDDDAGCSNSESSHENSPYLSGQGFKKNPKTGYLQPVMNSAAGFLQSASVLANNPPTAPSSQASTSYVRAAFAQPPIFKTPSAVTSPQSSGYVCHEDLQAKSMNLPQLGPTSAKIFGPESLPTMPTLPPSNKIGVDSSYIQLQSLDSLPSQKPIVRNTVPLKPPASSGYVSQGDAVINKHLNNILSAGQLTEEPAILDPTMSPDAYCRFSWSTDPANDNLRSLLAESPSINSSNN